jgi:Mn2+/Fe2+ NRAMP family transporter
MEPKAQLKKDKIQNLFKTLGPGILFASTCIGVSHLVQSTQAGASYVLSLLWVVILANVLKYPLFEYGARYANATGESLLDGYKKLGDWALYLYIIITLATMFFVTATVGNVTAGFLQNLFGFSSLFYTNIGLFLVCGTILVVGKFKILDSLVKIIGIVLLISTVAAFCAALFQGPKGDVALFSGDMFPQTIFLIALMGWMPTAVDLSTWSSLWTVERIKTTGYHPTLKETLFDFNFGYLASIVLAVCFITMGAFIIYGTDTTMGAGAAEFSNDVVNLYSETLGSWSYIIIAAAAFSIMFGTAIAVFDGYGRAMTKSIQLTINPKNFNETKYYRIVTVLTMLGGFLVILFFQDSFKALVTFTTVFSLIVAPIIAILNTVLVQKKRIGKKAPKLWLRILSYMGIVYLIAFSIYAVYLILEI